MKWLSLFLPRQVLTNLLHKTYCTNVLHASRPTTGGIQAATFEPSIRFVFTGRWMIRSPFRQRRLRGIIRRRDRFTPKCVLTACQVRRSHNIKRLREMRALFQEEAPPNAPSRQEAGRLILPCIIYFSAQLLFLNDMLEGLASASRLDGEDA